MSLSAEEKEYVRVHLRRQRIILVIVPPVIDLALHWGVSPKVALGRAVAIAALMYIAGIPLYRFLLIRMLEKRK